MRHSKVLILHCSLIMSQRNRDLLRKQASQVSLLRNIPHSYSASLPSAILQAVPLLWHSYSLNDCVKAGGGFAKDQANFFLVYAIVRAKWSSFA